MHDVVKRPARRVQLPSASALGIAATLMLAIQSTAVSAHEFWISPLRGVVSANETIVADLKVGQNLKGETYPYLSDRFRSFTVTNGTQTTTINGIEGDLPAVEFSSQGSGLHVIANHTVPFRVDYDDWSVFKRFLADEGLGAYEARHHARGLPQQGFSERYTRCAKALVQVGPAQKGEHDTFTGMPFELVALGNPYVPETVELQIKLLWQGKPVGGQQINVFHRSETTTRFAVKTDENGETAIPLKGAGEYLLNSVHLQPSEPAPVVWESHWASLSFKLPTR